MGDVLLLNRHLYAVAFASWQRALALVYLDHAHVIDAEYRTYDFPGWLDFSRTANGYPSGYIHTPRLKIAMPEVVALRSYDKVPWREVPFTRRNIYLHYGNRCCYCGKHLPPGELNLDHVIPRSRGGGTDWSNIVTACIPCNLRKGDRLPAEAGMAMVIAPSKPHGHNGAALRFRSPTPFRESWNRFLNASHNGNGQPRHHER